MRRLVSIEMGDCHAEGPKGPWWVRLKVLEMIRRDNRREVWLNDLGDAANYPVGVMEVKRMLLEFGL